MDTARQVRPQVRRATAQSVGGLSKMSGRYDWGVAQQLHSVPFDALIFAAILKADNQNLERLMSAFPHLVSEANLHYHGRYEDDPAMTQIDQNRTHLKRIGTESNFTCACVDNYVCNYHVLLKAHEQSQQAGT